MIEKTILLAALGVGNPKSKCIQQNKTIDPCLSLTIPNISHIYILKIFN